MLSRMKATSEPRPEGALDEALAARQESGSDPVELREMGPEWRAASVEQVRVSPDVRESPLTEWASGSTRKNYTATESDVFHAIQWQRGCRLSFVPYESPRDIDCGTDMR